MAVSLLEVSKDGMRIYFHRYQAPKKCRVEVAVFELVTVFISWKRLYLVTDNYILP